MAQLLGHSMVTVEGRFRNEAGQFLSRCRVAGKASADQLAEAIADLASRTAWSRSKPITAIPGGGMSAEALAMGDLAAIQEFGAKPHAIDSHDGNALANPDTGFFAPSGHVNHPGVKARHFLSQAAAAASAMAPGIIARNYPG